MTTNLLHTSFVYILKTALLIAGLSLSTHAFSAYENNQQAPLYSGPSDKSPLSHNGLPAKTSFQLIRKEGAFSLIQTPAGELGWIKNQYVRYIASPAELKATQEKATQQASKLQIAPAQNAQLKSPHANRKLNAVVEVISPDADPNTQAMIRDEGNSLEQANTTEIINPTTGNESLSQKEKLLQSINNALSQQVPTAATATNSIVATSTTSTLSAHHNNSSSTYIFDSTPAANRLELLSEENHHLRSELEKAKTYILKNIPTKDTQTLYEENELLQSQLVLLRTENQRLQENNQDKSFFDNMLLFIIGIILGFILNKILNQRNKHSDW